MRRAEGEARVEIDMMSRLRTRPEHTFVSALATATRVTEHPHVPLAIMGLTGLAFYFLGSARRRARDADRPSS